jgi:cellulose synthase/poly-beta-1,6-N-acetylglucosamine synthase-like glycosyltransferase/peptidoglycan/xylan/chitin deacetylase (PgdA/CDA1 family)/spore germination protein YaaH
MRSAHEPRSQTPMNVVERTFVPPPVIAFLDPSVKGALTSLRRHAKQIASVALTGLVLADDGSLIDRIDQVALHEAHANKIRTSVLIQNLDEHDGGWRARPVHTLARDPRSRAHMIGSLRSLCARDRLSGVHLDLEDLDDDWPLLLPIVDDVARALHADGLEVAVDVPAELEPALLTRLGQLADRVVVMAYDEHDQDAAPGPIASDSFVEDALRTARQCVPTTKLTAGLAIYGYDWIGSDPADAISFVDAHTAAKEAHVLPQWEPSGNSRVRYSDDEGHHDVWITDAASVWNQARIASSNQVGAIALWRLGGEDPGIWNVLAGATAPDQLAKVDADDRVENVGDGPFLSLSLAPQAGRRELHAHAGRITDERWIVSPSPFLIRRAGIVPGKVALTFDDGPDPRFTPQILDILKHEHVPASFFVVGMEAAKYPDVVKRAFAEGHELGNHSFTHPNVDAVGDLRLRTELESTSRLLESLIGRRPLLYRPPSLADIEPRTTSGAAAFARAGALGYVVVDTDADPRDWERPSGGDLIRHTLAEVGQGGVILLHDGGGDRSTTVRALPDIINGLRQRGMQFVPLTAMIGKQRDELMPIAPPRTGPSNWLARVFIDASVGASQWLRFALLFALALVLVRATFVIAFSIVSQRKRRQLSRIGPLPTVTCVIPAFNERAVITRTIDSVLASDIPVEIVVIDDGSTDDTSLVVRQRYLREPRVRLIRQENAGKSEALRTGFAAARTEVIVALDGDTIFAPDTVRKLIEPMRDRRIGAVAGTAEVGNLENGLTRWQALEYLMQQELERRAWDSFQALPIVPGAVGAWRRRAVYEAGGFSSETLAEDADLAMALCRLGWRVVHAPHARARTEAPSQLTSLIKQRVRWSFGVLQALWKHRMAPFDERAGAFGRLVWPAMILFQVLLPVLTPFALIAVAAAAVSGNLRPAWTTSACLFAVELIQFLVAATLALRSGGRGFRLAPSLLGVRFLYRPVLLMVMLRSLVRLLDGVPLYWNKLARRNTVIAYSAVASVAQRSSMPANR